MVHAPELLGYEQYTPFPAACQWQSERPPPVAGAFAGLFMALGAPLLAWERPALTAGLPRALAREPAPFVAANSTYSFRLRLSPSEGRPALAAAHRVSLGGRRPPFWRKGTPKTGKRRPPHFLARLSPFGLAPTVIYRAHPSLWTSEGRPAGRPLIEFPLGAAGPHFGERARQKPANVARLIFQFASPLLAWRLLSFTGPTQVCGLRKEDRPWRAAQRVCLGGHRPHFGGRARQKPANVARLIF